MGAIVAAIGLLLAFRVATGLVPLAEAQGGTRAFELATIGCSMAHCDPRLSDRAGLVPPGAGADLIWHDLVEGVPGTFLGSSKGLGCVSNGTDVACTFGRQEDELCNRDTLIAYGYADLSGDPFRKWTSGDVLNCTAFTSAPLMDVEGGVITADSTRVVRFAANGDVLWQTVTPGGRPVSPVITSNGIIVLATSQGPIYAYDNQTGALIDNLILTEGSGRYDTNNTAAVRDNRAYITTDHRHSSMHGRLYAVDVVLPEGYDPTDPSTYRDADILQDVWYVRVGGPSGASPLVISDTVYFDGDRLTPESPYGPHIFAVRDEGSQGTIEWTLPMPGDLRASFAEDPRGGLWAVPTGALLPDENELLTRIAAEDLDGDGQGDVLETLSLDMLVDAEGIHVPTSAMTIAGDPADPIMIVGTTARDEAGNPMSTFVLAINLNARSLLWEIALPGASTAGQFPIALGEYGPRIFFTNRTRGTWVIGEPSQGDEVMR
ncbi:MAG: PQQ-binding-like beta-propeller repeat protein [Ardenticatenaceae bacterium]